MEPRLAVLDRYLAPFILRPVMGTATGVLAGLFGTAFFALYLLLPVIGALKSVADSQYATRLFGALTVTGSHALHGLFNTAFGAELLLCFSPVATAVPFGYCKDAPARRTAR